MTQLCSHHRPVSLLVEDTQAFDDIFKRALVLVFSDGLEHGQELLKIQQLVVHLCGSPVGTEVFFLIAVLSHSLPKMGKHTGGMLAQTLDLLLIPSLTITELRQVCL